MRPESYVAEPVASRDIHRGDTVIWNRTATSVLAEPVARIADRGMRVDYDVRLSLDTIRTVTVRGTHTFWRVRPRWEAA